jgi:hypothetical protein
MTSQVIVVKKADHDLVERGELSLHSSVSAIVNFWLVRSRSINVKGLSGRTFDTECWTLMESGSPLVAWTVIATKIGTFSLSYRL